MGGDEVDAFPLVSDMLWRYWVCGYVPCDWHDVFGSARLAGLIWKIVGVFGWTRSMKLEEVETEDDSSGSRVVGN